MNKPRCTDHTVTIVDEENERGEVSRWECSACKKHGHWTPTAERLLVAQRGHAHTLRSRKPRPRKGAARVAPSNEYRALREVLDLGGGF